MIEISGDQDSGEGLSWRALVLFFGLTFAIAWGIVLLLILIPDRMSDWFGEISGHHPLFVLAVYAPAISATGIVLVHSGPAGLARYLARLALWRGAGIWWAVLLVGIPAIYFAGAALKGTLSGWQVPFPSVSSALGAILLAGLVGPVEEIGWRGFAMPLLQKRLAPLFAAILLGVVWGLWHLPAFYLGGTPQSAWDFAPFFAGTIGISVILTPVFNATRGSILWPALFHWQFNNPLWPDAQPFDMWLMTATAIIVTIAFWPDMISNRNAVRTIYGEG